MMTTPSSTDYSDLFFEHLRVLREYAERVFTDGESLTAEEEEIKAYHVDQFLDAGKNCEFTDQQLVRLLFSELLD